MADLTEVDGHAVLSEDYYRLGDNPIMICVLTFAREFYVVGLSLSRSHLFDDEMARLLARRNAKANALKRFADRPQLAKAAE